ncbi:glycoside hydrolase [Blastopirellula sp. JC732]|uniref:exo-alpha-sialidase n=1 Tax=Blastopirellula sediminis TaxID=2894196 RepID=A0A9X1MIC0_9BACT|nr:sialidase family protein [Blastopirellula sediminis]MCC9607901.1 glycoside hydrolase [Blastopirellula sediminis]MCC9627306.1 glycoside hydrolase [Blastopirellula sediminis]
MKRMLQTALLALLVVTSGALLTAGELHETVVFKSGMNGYNTYRIPSVITAKDGTLLAFIEARKNNMSDTGDIDLVLRRSKDNGATWSDAEVIWDDEGNVCGNPCPVVDQSTGKIWLLLTWNSGKTPEGKIQPGFGADSRRVFVASSEDNGQTWTAPQEITADVKDKEWTWYATGPGSGIQIEHGPHAGRLVIPCDHKWLTGGKLKFGSHVIYSDDHGKTWQLGGSAPDYQVNECEVVELKDGKLLLNMRNYDRKQTARQVCVSADGGKTWTDQKFDPTLVEPICQGSVHRYRWPAGDKPGIVLFSNPASAKDRTAMTVRASYDDCQTWPVERRLFDGSSAYSSLTVLPNGQIGCLYERNGYKEVVFARFDLDWLRSADK